MSQITEPYPLIRTKLHRPRVSRDLLDRPRLLEWFHARRRRPLTLISAPAGYGKTTLVSQWLAQAPYPAAWLSLDENDNDVVVFLNYFAAALRTLFPQGCSTTHHFLTASPAPPLDYLIATLINEINDLSEEFLLVLDDYHLIEEQAIHRLISALARRAPPPLHLIIVSRQDVPFYTTRLRASQTMAEIRMADLRFTPEETQRYLELYLGPGVSPETVAVLADRTEGWAVGLRLACLAVRNQENGAGFLEAFRGTDRYIMEYLVDEVLAYQPQPIQIFLLYTSILERFCASLSEALLAVTSPEIAGGQDQPSGQEILAQLEKDNLFVVSLDHQGEWFRYHHLFKDLLRYKFKAETTPAQRAALHTTAGTWLDQNDFVEEALRHYFAANNTAAAARLVARRRYALMNQAEWAHLEQRLRQFSPDILDQYPDLLMLKTWLIYHRGQWAALPAAVQRLEAAMARASLTPEEINGLQGEISALRGLLFYHAVDPKNALTQVRQSLEKTPPALWIVRVLARLYLAGVLQMRGDTNQAYATIYRGLEEEETQSNRFKATLVITACNIYWLDADLPGMVQAAKQCLTLSQDGGSPQILNYGRYHLGAACYQQNDLTAAEQHFAAVTRQPYLNYGDCFAQSACGLALTYQVQGRPDEARPVIEAAGAFMLETGNTTLMPVIQALQAEFALRQGQIASAGQWAAHLDPPPPLRPIYQFFSPHLTLVKIWLAQDTPAGRHQAADLLEKVKAFVEATHNTRFLIEALALQALLKERQDERRTALELLAQAVELARPGGFIRLFLDLGPPLARLLAGLKSKDSGQRQYIQQLLTAFDREKPQPSPPRPDGVPEPLIEPLTNRELEVLALLARRLSDKEIAERLVISPLTVKTHTKNIFGKLNVNRRRQAVIRARNLGLLSSENTTADHRK